MSAAELPSGGYDELIAKFRGQGMDIATEMDFGGYRVAYADTRATLDDLAPCA
jgi:hypothetical protein